MYAAHAEQKRKESSQILLNDTLSSLEAARSDNDKFLAVLEVNYSFRIEPFDFVCRVLTVTKCKQRQ